MLKSCDTITTYKPNDENKYHTLHYDQLDRARVQRTGLND
jgi:hypothetical protein